jgi:hypothetical protein
MIFEAITQKKSGEKFRKENPINLGAVDMEILLI